MTNLTTDEKFTNPTTDEKLINLTYRLKNYQPNTDEKLTNITTDEKRPTQLQMKK